METVDGQVSPDHCIFCAIVAGKEPAVVVYEDEHTVAFMDINPAVRGHVLVVPRQHARDIFDVSEDHALHVMRTVLRVARAVEMALEPDGLNLFQANRRAALQSVFHFHMHVLPRWWDDGLMPVWHHERGDPDVLREIGAMIRAAL